MTTAAIQVMPKKKPAACNAYATVAMVLSCLSSATSAISDPLDHDALAPGFQPGGDVHVALRHTIVRGEERDQSIVRFAFRGRRRQPQLDAPAMLAGELGALGAGLHMQLEDHSPAATMRRWLSGISSTYRITSRTIGERSTRPTGGTQRRSGRRNGRVSRSNSGPSGASGLIHEIATCTNTANTRM